MPDHRTTTVSIHIQRSKALETIPQHGEEENIALSRLGRKRLEHRKGIEPFIRFCRPAPLHLAHDAGSGGRAGNRTLIYGFGDRRLSRNKLHSQMAEGEGIEPSSLRSHGFQDRLLSISGTLRKLYVT